MSGADGYGSLFKLTKGTGGYTYSNLWNFTGGADGAYPEAPPALLSGSGDRMIGTTFEGPVNGTNAGTLWEYANGRVTTLYTFTGGADGGNPQGTPVLDTSGNVYGTTSYGGVAPCNTTGGTLISTFGCGTVFEYGAAPAE